MNLTAYRILLPALSLALLGMAAKPSKEAKMAASQPRLILEYPSTRLEDKAYTAHVVTSRKGWDALDMDGDLADDEIKPDTVLAKADFGKESLVILVWMVAGDIFNMSSAEKNGGATTLTLKVSPHRPAPGVVEARVKTAMAKIYALPKDVLSGKVEVKAEGYSGPVQVVRWD